MNPYLVDRLPGDRAYSWVLACDPNKRHGGVLVAVDHLEDWFVVAEHYRENVPDSKHAEAYLAMLRGLKLEPNRDVSIWADPGGAGAQAIINMAEVGLYAQPVPKDAGSVKASIERIRRQAWIDPGHHHPITGVRGAPRLYFLTSLRSEWELDGVRYAESRLMWELRQYRQKPNGRPDEPIKVKDDCLAGDTLVETAGGPVAIRDLVGTEGLVVTPTGLHRYHAVRPTHDGVPQPVMRLTFEDGRTLTCTPSHPLLTPDGWRRADSGCTAVLDIPHAVNYCQRCESHYRGSGAAVSGAQVRPNGERLLPVHSSVAASGGVEGSQWPHSGWPSGAPQGREPGEQRAGEPGTPDRRGASGIAPDAGETGRHGGSTQGAPPGGSPTGGGMARFPGRDSVASRSRPQVLGSAIAEAVLAGPDVRVWDGLHAPDFAPGFLFQPLQVGSPPEVGGGQRVAPVLPVRDGIHGQSLQPGDALLETVPRPYAVRITHREYLPEPIVVYNMEVDAVHCFAVAGGLVVHNCVDPLRYVALVRPQASAPEDRRIEVERGRLDDLSRKASEEYDLAVARAMKPKQQRDRIW